MSKEETIILSLGGSIIVPNGGINTKFLSQFNTFIRKKVAEGRRFFIVCGGGSTSRHYRDVGMEVIGEVTEEDLDWLGIHATRLNAHLLRTIFMDIAHPRIIENYKRRLTDPEKYPVIIAAGWKPGWSTDYCAVLLAKDYHVSTVINLSNIDMVYDKDPRKYPKATPIEKTNWPYFRSLVGDRWKPGMNVPFDPIASDLAEKLDLTLIVLKGNNLDNLGKVFTGQKFVGTVVAPEAVGATFFDREYFDGGKGEYSGYTTGLRSRIFSYLANLYRAFCIRLFLNPRKVLDVGCGTGRMVYWLRRLGIDAQGLEISKYVISRAGAETQQFITHGDIMSLPYPDKSFDLVTTFDVLEHITTNNLEKAVFECDRVARTRVLHKMFTVENTWIRKFHGSDLSHVSVYGKGWWEKFWKDCGYKKAKVIYSHLPLWMETLFVLEKK